MRTKLRQRRGNALIEMAFAVAVMLPIFSYTFEFGYTFYVYNLLSTQARGGSRYASLRTFRSSDNASIEKYKAAVRNMVRYSTPDGSGMLIVPGVTDANVVVDITDQDGNPADNTRTPAFVTVSTANFAINSIFATKTFNGKPSVTFPYLGRYAPTETEP